MHDFEPIRYTVAAHVLEPTDIDYEEIDKAAKGFFIASDSPFENGKPRMLFINAWIVHEGRNLNGDAFVSEELKERVNQGLFSPPFAGMIDLDHDFTARGFWYKANYAFDEKANKWGILATGAIWAWRYKDLASFMLQEMAEDGFVTVSMSAIAEMVEPTFTYAGFEGQKTMIRHNPVFFTSAVLTVPPGDPDAKGTVTTASEDTSKEADKASSSDLTSRAIEDFSEITISNQESKMDNKELEALKATNAQLQQEIADLKVKLTEAEVNLKAVSDIRTTVEQELETVKSDLKVFKDKEAAEAEKNKAEAEKKKFESRLAEVPDVVRENLEKHPNKELVLAKWKDAPDGDWDIIKQGFALSHQAAPTYLTRSKEEGKLPVGSKDDKENNLKNFLRE